MRIVMLEPLGITRELALKLAEPIKTAGHEFIYYDNRPEEKKEIIARSKEADILIASNIPLDKEVLEQCPQLQMISVAFTGVDHIDMEYCRNHDITVSNSSGYANQAVAELVIGLIISLKRDLITSNQQVRQQATGKELVGQELKGKKFGIIGTGDIGLETAKLAKAFGCELLGYSRSERSEAEELGIKYMTLTELLEESDIISLHVPLTRETEGLLGQEEIKKMKSSAILINAARGPVVDSKALAQALREDKLAGAGIDVFEQEPPIPEDHPLLNAPKVVATPHIGYATREAFQKRAKIVFDNIEKWLAGEAQNVMN